MRSDFVVPSTIYLILSEVERTPDADASRSMSGTRVWAKPLLLAEAHQERVLDEAQELCQGHPGQGQDENPEEEEGGVEIGSGLDDQVAHPLIGGVELGDEDGDQHAADGKANAGDDERRRRG